MYGRYPYSCAMLSKPGGSFPSPQKRQGRAGQGRARTTSPNSWETTPRPANSPQRQHYARIARPDPRPCSVLFCSLGSLLLASIGRYARHGVNKTREKLRHMAKPTSATGAHRRPLFLSRLLPRSGVLP
ncbi:hypothetical protein LX32DRAFT_37812 [Colletotrichum zoysiae]|uniref:Uncharacterized protein n=1 Tax=Colletotrichum zoysiae TaxID=1216348 RepID=A0AAD9LXH9_9PEZI|nr:hypothetical protein LX32DRAFT_37812 [Colletotrichum zoysiae]